MTNILLVPLILLLLHLPIPLSANPTLAFNGLKAREISRENMRNLENIGHIVPEAVR